MKHYKLPFNIVLNQKYNDINIENFIEDWYTNEENRKFRNINIDNALHIEMGKFSTYEISIDEVIDLCIRYALQKREFRKMIAQLIEIKNA